MPYIRIMMLVVWVLLSVPFTTHALDSFSFRLQNNTPPFDQAGCNVYSDREAVRAMMRLIVSSRISLEVHAFDFNSTPFNGLLNAKVRYGQSVTLYSQSGHFPREFHNQSNVQLRTIEQPDRRGPLIIRTDRTFVGVGNIDLEDPLEVRSTFMVCYANETADMIAARLNHLRVNSAPSPKVKPINPPFPEDH